MAIVCHIRSDKRPLGQSLSRYVTVKTVEILDQGQTRGVLGDRLIQDQRIMFAYVVIGKGFLVGEIETLEAGIWHGFLIFRPRDALGVEQINDGGDVRRDVMEVVIVHAKIVPSHRRAIVWLRRVGGGPVVGQRNAHFSQGLLIWVACR